MANRNPWQARMKGWQRLWPVPIAELQAQAYGVLMVAHEGVAVDDAEQRHKNILAYFQGLSAFPKLRETLEHEARLAALEESVRALITARQTCDIGPWSRCWRSPGAWDRLA
jgi:hypothetical protein